jgi:transposase
VDVAQAPSAEDFEALKAALATAQAELATARAQRSDDAAMIAHLKLEIAVTIRRRPQAR